MLDDPFRDEKCTRNECISTRKYREYIETKDEERMILVQYILFQEIYKYKQKFKNRGKWSGKISDRI